MSVFLIITLILLSFNLPFLMWSNRKRKYGIYPGVISILTFILLLGYYSSVMVFNSRPESPSVKNFKKGEIGLREYNKSVTDYAEQSIQSERKIAHYLNDFTYFFLAAKIQCFIALGLSVFGLFYVSNRNTFYWMLISVYLVVLSSLFLAEWFGSLR